MKKLMLSVFALAAVVLSVSAQNTAKSKTLASSADCVLMKTLSLSTTLTDGSATSTTLNFGTLAIGASAGTSLIPASASPTATLDQVAQVAGTPTAATFGVTGDNNASFTITIPTSAVYLTGTTGANISSWTCSSALSTSLSATGKKDFFVGATLSVPSDATPGSYQKAFNVTVAYN